RLPWGWIASGCAAAFAAIVAMAPYILYVPYVWPADIVVGLGSMALLIYCAAGSLKPRDQWPPVLDLLSVRPVVALGSFSYSLYLIHEIVLSAIEVSIRRHQLGPAAAAVVMPVAGIGASLVAAYLFYLA